MLENHTHRYESLPACLTILIVCSMVVLFFLFGQLVGGATLGLLLMPMVLLKSEMASTVFGSIYFQLGLFSFVALSQFAWVKWYEKRSISSLGFSSKAGLEILKGWGVGMGIFTFAFALDLSIWWGEVTKRGLFVVSSCLCFINYPVLVCSRRYRKSY